jgi:hypothetical protein
MAEVVLAAAAARRGVDIVIDQLLDDAKYVFRTWSAYGASIGDAQDIADYADHVATLLLTLRQSDIVSKILKNI